MAITQSNYTPTHKYLLQSAKADKLQLHFKWQLNSKSRCTNTYRQIARIYRSVYSSHLVILHVLLLHSPPAAPFLLLSFFALVSNHYCTPNCSSVATMRINSYV